MAGTAVSGSLLRPDPEDEAAALAEAREHEREAEGLRKAERLQVTGRPDGGRPDPGRPKDTTD
jgi:ubiquinol-cytochrome c reductase cytochrome b subunit